MSNSKAILPAVASLAASAMLIRSITNDFIPNEVHNFFSSILHNLSHHFSSQLTIVIEEYNGITKNEMFEAAEVYLGTKATLSAQRVKVAKSEDDKKLAFSVDRDEEVTDVHENVQLKWKLICVQAETSSFRHPNNVSVALKSEMRYYELTFHKKHKENVFNSFLPYVLERANAIKQQHKAVKLHRIDYDYWSRCSVNLSHPMTLNTLAMEAGLKKELVDDLAKFVNGKQFYRRTGKAWKRGYLLYGPPGTGKSSLIAAMANYLNYDIYDLDLSVVQTDSQLKSLLLGMSNRSILVVEDIDCSLKLQNRGVDDDLVNNGDNKVTLSGLLNAIDGLWSCCGEERIIIFTTNHKERLDTALLRPGRMDMHVHMSYCSFSTFRQLAMSYLGISEHKLFQQIEGLIGEVQVTPAEIAGELSKSAADIEDSLQSLVKFIDWKKMKQQDKAQNDQYVKDHEQEGK